MKIREGFVIRELADHYVVVSVSTEKTNFQGMIQLNETGAFLWNEFSKETDKDSVVNHLLETYEITQDRAEKDVESFIQKLSEAGLFCEND
ncbi:MAG: PqqD family protein [Eubacteriales bacterium]|nr:PqqD family protein [Eubacteriales bacterium]